VPLYDYECQACGTVHEIRHGFNDSVDYPCPKCGTGKLVRKFHAAPIVFKGSGFYVTDSRGSNPGSKPKSDSASGDSKSESSSDSKPETKSESKPETKSESKPEAAA
jgi:putative FmdB family regulatory protein